MPNTHRVMRSWTGQARRIGCAKRRPTTKQCVFVAHMLKKDGNPKTTFGVGSQFVLPTQERLHASLEDGMQHFFQPFMGALYHCPHSVLWITPSLGALVSAGPSSLNEAERNLKGRKSVSLTVIVLMPLFLTLHWLCSSCFGTSVSLCTLIPRLSMSSL